MNDSPDPRNVTIGRSDQESADMSLGRPEPPNSEDRIDLLHLLLVLARHKRLVIGLPLIAAVIAAAISVILPKSYTATARILPPAQNQTSTAMMLLGQLAGGAGLVAGGLGIKNPSELYVGMLKSRTVADALVHRFDLQLLYDSKFIEDARKTLADRTEFTFGRDGIIAIEVTDRDPKRSADVANAYVEELQKLTQTLAVTEASQRRLFLEGQLHRTKEDLASAEVELKKTQEATGLIKLDDQGRAIIEAIAGIRAQISAREVGLAAMRSFMTEQNPDMVRTQREIEGLRTELRKLERRSAGVEAGIMVPVGQVPEVGLEYLRRVRDVKYQEVMFELLAKQYEIARIDEARDAFVVQPMDRAVTPTLRSGPKRVMIVLASFLVFFIVSVILAFVLQTVSALESDPKEHVRLQTLRSLLFGK